MLLRLGLLLKDKRFMIMMTTMVIMMMAAKMCLYLEARGEQVVKEEEEEEDERKTIKCIPLIIFLNAPDAKIPSVTSACRATVDKGNEL
mmetsp:Transcript_25785/g.41682  ORF Transcript_25785/g.41682 Transcript_25785/m.41682 type:complete len:89 (+) Transcript_25785:569-835(+)